ncbi:YHS domain-containing (seleno)protein [Dawidia soli]|nr:YHS domain-containing (seleno)protein [Dawidia soli]
MFRTPMFLMVALFFAASSLYAQTNARTKEFNLENNVALQGYDPVAYFTVQKAVPGKKEFAVQVEGVTYYLSSAANKALFQKEPARYVPQYGGWCAYAMGAKGEKVEVDPETFKVLDGKLYLFYNAYFNNTLPKWNQDEAKLKAAADKNWAGIVH